jgi:hypothetical protein
MVFGRKKTHQQEETLEEESPPRDRVDLDDYSSDGENSVPPPPPGLTSAGNMFRNKESHNTNELNQKKEHNLGDEGEENGVSFLTDYDDEDDNDNFKKDKERDSHRRKKFLLIFLFLATLAVLVGLSVKYAHKQPSELPVATSEAEISPEDSYSEVGPTTVTSTPAVGTAAPTEDGTEEATLDATESGTDTGTEVGTDEGTKEQTEVGFTFQYDCADHQIFASSSCKNDVTSWTIVICMKGPIKNKYWSWIDYPADFEVVAADDWGWLSDGMTIHRTDVPTGVYEIGIYGSDDELVTSTTFNVMCGP